MADTWHLKERLRIAIACVPLALAGCTKSPREGTSPSPTVMTAADAAVVVAVVVDAGVMASTTPTPSPTPILPQPRPDWNMPSCPDGDWCGTSAVAGKMKLKGSTTEQGCASALDLKQRPKELASLSGDLPTMDWSSVNLDATATAERRKQGPANACCYHWNTPCPGGRPALEGGRAQLAEVFAGAARHPRASDAELGLGTLAGHDDLRLWLSRAWLADARAEHASIASFARAEIELTIAGAPAALLTACRRARADEVRHARACFTLASVYAGRHFSPGELPTLTTRRTLSEIAVATFLEGCVGETIAALAATRALAGCRTPGVTRVLGRIVRDETRHAELAWRTIAWAIATGGPEVRSALMSAATTARLEPEHEHEHEHVRALGRLSPLAQSQAAHDAWTQIITPTLALL